MKSSTALLSFLAEQPDRRFVDPEGRVNRLLRDAIEYPGSPGGMSQLLAGLETKGLIHRVLHGRRCPVVELTPAGAEFLASEGVSFSPAAKASSKAVEKATPKAAKKAAAKPATKTSAKATKTSAVEPTPEKRKPGRPKKAVAAEEVPEVVEKRKPGRPRKIATEASAPVAVPASVPDEEWEAPAKKPGRPKKVTQADAVAPEAPIAASDTELLDTSEIAQALLSLVVSELTNLDGRAASEAAIRDELAQSAARAEALEERTRSLEDSLAYAKAEAQAERARADRLEKNLDAVMKGPDTSRGKEEARRQLERLISARPGR